MPGNVAEYAPLALLLMALVELQASPGWQAHAIGAALLAGRAVHALGVGREPEDPRWRAAGMGLTFTALAAGALANLGPAVRAAAASGQQSAAPIFTNSSGSVTTGGQAAPGGDCAPMADDQIKLDLERRRRLGFDEAVFCAGKSMAQLAAILDQIAALDLPMLLTRLEPPMVAALADRHRAAIDYDPVSRTGFFNGAPPGSAPRSVAVISAGSSDVPVAVEAVRTLRFNGIGALAVHDVGVAGLWRLMARIDEIKALPVVIVVAGMDGALASVVGGLVPGLVIAVPTSVGYGAARGGETALHAALASCAPGLLVCNIDNGYGAACAAIRALNMMARR